MKKSGGDGSRKDNKDRKISKKRPKLLLLKN